MSHDQAHEDIDDNLMRPFWRHAQIEEQDAQFHETVNSQSMEDQGSFEKQYPKETVISITNT